MHFLGLVGIAFMSGEGSIGLLSMVFGVDAFIGLAILLSAFSEDDS
jgi:hypothetical protein